MWRECVRCLSPADTNISNLETTFQPPPPPPLLSLHTRMHTLTHTLTHTRTHARTHARTQVFLNPFITPPAHMDSYNCADVNRHPNFDN